MVPEPFKRQFLFDHFVGLALKGLRFTFISVDFKNKFNVNLLVSKSNSKIHELRSHSSNLAEISLLYSTSIIMLNKKLLFLFFTYIDCF